MTHDALINDGLMNDAATPPAVVVIPATRPTLVRRVLETLAEQAGVPSHIVVVDDSADGSVSRELQGHHADVVRGLRRGPAAARNTGWRHAVATTTTAWVAFLDDDVIPSSTWGEDLRRDLAAAADDVGGVAGRIHVPLTTSRPDDWERQTMALETASWITADMAYRVEALASLGGFDERFPRAFREDSDLALRATQAGWRLVRGERLTEHPVRPAPWHVSLSRQAGNADNALMRRRHGADWRRATANPPSALPGYAVTTALLTAGLAGLAASVRRHPGRSATGRLLTAAALLGWSGRTIAFAWRRIAPGPRTLHEVATMTATSALIPPLALGHRLAGELRHRSAGPSRPPVRAVLFDKDGTLVHDVPYNGDPAKVRAVDDARSSISRLREAGVHVGLVSNQSGIARGLLEPAQVDAVLARTGELVGGFDTVQVCPHDDTDGCSCRKPRPGMVLAAAEALRVRPEECVVVGDIGADIGAARAAGARSVLVPTAATRSEECLAAPHRASTLTEAVDLILGGRV